MLLSPESARPIQHVPDFCWGHYTNGSPLSCRGLSPREEEHSYGRGRGPSDTVSKKPRLCS